METKSKSKYQKGGKVAAAKKVVKTLVKTSPEYKAYKAVGKTAKGIDDAIEKRYPNYTGKGSFYDGVKQGVKSLLGYKTGGMVNANSKVSKQTVPGSKGVKSGVNPKAAASKVARGRVGGTSAAPKTALPKAQGGCSAYTPPNQPGGTPRAGGYVSGNGLSKPVKKSKVKADFKTMMRNASKKG